MKRQIIKLKEFQEILRGFLLVYCKKINKTIKKHTTNGKFLKTQIDTNRSLVFIRCSRTQGGTYYLPKVKQLFNFLGWTLLARLDIVRMQITELHGRTLYVQNNNYHFQILQLLKCLNKEKLKISMPLFHNN